MVADAVHILYVVFSQCLVWFQDIIDAVDGKYFIVSAFTIVAVSALIIYPIRGSGFSAVGFSDFTKQAISFGKSQHDPRHLRGYSPSVSYRGKFERNAKRYRVVGSKRR